MNYKGLSFLLNLIILFSISCNQEAKFGLGFLPADDTLNIYIDTTSINAYTLRDDSLETSFPSQFLLGAYIDPIFGKVKAEFATQVLLNNSSSFHPYYLEGTAKSLTVYLKFDNITIPNTYGNGNEELQINVYKINKILKSTDLFYANDNSTNYHDNELIGTAILKNFKDTLPIELNLSLAQDFIDNSMYYFSLSDTLRFFQKFYGLYFSISSNSTDGMIARFNPSSASTKMVLEYSSSISDSLSYTFLINSNCVSANFFTHDFTGTELENLNTPNNVKNTDSVVYLQSMGGTKIKLDFPNISKYQNIKNLVINKAELVVKTEKSNFTNETDYPAIDKMAIVKYDENNNLILIDEFLTQANTYTGSTYTDGEYRFLITRQIEDLIFNQNTEKFSLYLIPLQRRYNFGRSVITNGNHSNPMKLIITYTQY
jgi:hypothetical protein